MEGSIVTEAEQELTAEGLESKDLRFRVMGFRVIELLEPDRVAPGVI